MYDLIQLMTYKSNFCFKQGPFLVNFIKKMQISLCHMKELDSEVEEC